MGTIEEKKIFGGKLISLANLGVEVVEIQEHFEFLSNPLLPRLQTLLSFEDSPQDLAILAMVLDYPIDKVEEAIQTLQHLGLLEKAMDARWKQQKKSWKVSDSSHNRGLIEFYKNAFTEAQQALELPSEGRGYKGLFFALNEEQFQDYLKDFDVFIKEQLAKRNSETIKDHRLYQLTFAMVPVSKKV